MKKRKIVLILIFVLSFTLVGAMAVTHTQAQAFTMNLQKCVYDYQSFYCAGPYEATYIFRWEDRQPITTVNKYDYWVKKSLHDIRYFLYVEYSA